MVVPKFDVGPSTEYPFYSESERYVTKVTSDGGVLSMTESMYNPTLEQEAADRKAAYEAGIPHGTSTIAVAGRSAVVDIFVCGCKWQGIVYQVKSTRKMKRFISLL